METDTITLDKITAILSIYAILIVLVCIAAFIPILMNSRDLFGWWFMAGLVLTAISPIFLITDVIGCIYAVRYYKLKNLSMKYYRYYIVLTSIIVVYAIGSACVFYSFYHGF